MEKAGTDMATFEPIASGSQLLLRLAYINVLHGLPHMAKAGKSRRHDPSFSIKLLHDNKMQEDDPHGSPR